MDIDDFYRQFQSNLNKTIAGAEAISEEANQLIRASISKTISGLDIVSREEFDAQQAVLHRSREKIDLLEKQLVKLESLVRDNSK